MPRRARKSALPPKVKRVRHKKSHPLVLPSFEVLADGAHAVTIPVHTRNFLNLQTGNSRMAGIMRKRERAKERAEVGKHLFGIGVSFRGVTLVRLAPSSGLDTGGLWSALKGVQDAIAEHLGVDDGPKSPASWRMEQERNEAYGVRVELRMQREPSWNELRAEVAALFAELAATRAELKVANDQLAQRDKGAA